jgi:hypothetical protein
VYADPETGTQKGNFRLVAYRWSNHMAEAFLRRRNMRHHLGTKLYRYFDYAIQGVAHGRLVGSAVICLLVFATLSNAELYVIAHFPYGGGWGTRVLLLNGSGQTATVELNYFSQDGNPVSVPGVGSTNGALQLQINPSAVSIVEADPTQRNTTPLQVAWATVTSNEPLNIFTLFDLAPTTVPFTSASTTVLSAVGAQSSPPAQSFHFPISVNGSRDYNAGLAVANPNSFMATVSLNLLDSFGNLTATQIISLPPNGQTTLLLNQPFAASLASPSLFTGSVGICASVPVGLVALGVEGDILFTVPVSNDYPCS